MICKDRDRGLILLECMVISNGRAEYMTNGREEIRPDREVCDASSPLFLSWFLLFVYPFFSSLIAEKNTCRFGAR